MQIYNNILKSISLKAMLKSETVMRHRACLIIDSTSVWYLILRTIHRRVNGPEADCGLEPHRSDTRTVFMLPVERHFFYRKLINQMDGDHYRR